MHGTERRATAVAAGWPRRGAMMARSPPVSSTPITTASFAAPFRHLAFAVIWTATLVSNVGGWMYGAASAWLMTSLSPIR